MSDTETRYNKALDYLYSFVDYSLKHSSELARAEFNLDRMFALMHELGDPQSKYPIIHVAGTKGKGSVSALCAEFLEQLAEEGVQLPLLQRVEEVALPGIEPDLADHVRADDRDDVARPPGHGQQRSTSLRMRRSGSLLARLQSSWAAIAP